MRRNNRYAEFTALVGYALLILPAVALGILAMMRAGVPVALWGQQAAAWVVLALLACLLRRAARRISADTWGVLLLLFLAVSLLGEETGGARRWVNLGVFNVNAAMLVLPALIVMLSKTGYPCPLLIGAAAVVAVQPDLSQLLALSAAGIPALLRRGRRLQAFGCVLFLAVLGVRCISMPVTAEPVPYCEGILDLLGGVSAELRLAGWAALALVPAALMMWYFVGRNMQALSLALYYAVLLLFVPVGEYPVPFMGFGLSPIAGYYLAYVCGGVRG